MPYRPPKGASFKVTFCLRLPRTRANLTSYGHLGPFQDLFRKHKSLQCTFSKLEPAWAPEHTGRSHVTVSSRCAVLISMYKIDHPQTPINTIFFQYLGFILLTLIIKLNEHYKLFFYPMILWYEFLLMYNIISSYELLIFLKLPQLSTCPYCY